jgi:diphthine-ammonia ligase
LLNGQYGIHYRKIYGGNAECFKVDFNPPSFKRGKKMKNLKGVSAFCSWSGGKDSCLALYRAIQEGISPRYLLTMCVEEGGRTRSHGLSVDIIEAQAQSLGFPVITQNVSWSEYEKKYVVKLRHLKNDGIKCGIFGDIDIDENREWEEKVCQMAGLEPFLPLWKQKRLDLLQEFLSCGFKAVVVATNNEKLGKKFLGKLLDKTLVEEFKKLGIDPSGEEGEYHTVVVDGPIFSKVIHLNPGSDILRSGYWFKDFSLI